MTNSYEAKQAARQTRLENAAKAATDKAQSLYVTSRKMGESIPFGQPILVGHHSEKRDRNYRNNIDSKMRQSVEATERAEEFARRAAAIGTGGVSSDDPDAVTKLRDQLADLTAEQERNKGINAAIRKHKTETERMTAIMALGVPKELAHDLLHPRFSTELGVPKYRLTNNSANMRRIEKRITELLAANERFDRTIEGVGYIYKEDASDNRVMFEFASKPDKATRVLLQQNGFKWSPTRNDAWVRKWTNSAVYAAKCIRQTLDISNQ